VHLCSGDLCRPRAPNRQSRWLEFPACTTTSTHINGLVAKKFLPKQEESGWRLPPQGCRKPELQPDEVVVFIAFFERGLGLPVNCFLRGLLHFYEIKLHHLNPNTILQVAAFIVLCEAYLGIRPNFALWSYFFHMRLLPDLAGQKGSKTPAPVRGTGVQLYP
jgi:hypothetical protein